MLTEFQRFKDQPLCDICFFLVPWALTFSTLEGLLLDPSLEGYTWYSLHPILSYFTDVEFLPETLEPPFFTASVLPSQ